MVKGVGVPLPCRSTMATKQDYDGFADQLVAIGRPIVVGFEATGNYHRTLAHRLLTAGPASAAPPMPPSDSASLHLQVAMATEAIMQ